MRILFCTGIFPPESGGPATYTEKMATELMRRGHGVRVVTYSDAKETNTYLFPVHRVIRTGSKPLNYLKYLFTVLWWGRGADVLYLQDLVSAGYPAYLANKVLRKKMAVRVPGDYSWEQAHNKGLTDDLPEAFQHHTSYPGTIGKMRNIQIKVARGADKVVLPAATLRPILTGWGVDSRRIVVIYTGMETPSGTPTREEARKQLGLSKSDFLAVSIGRDIPLKGFDVLRSAVMELNKNVEKVKLSIYSTAPRQEVLTALSAADVFVLNTAFENFSITVLEALAIGTPVVTTSIGGNTEVIEHEETGLFVEFNNNQQIQDALERLLNEPRLRKKLSEQGKVKAREFTVERMVGETENTLQELYN